MSFPSGLKTTVPNNVLKRTAHPVRRPLAGLLDRLELKLGPGKRCAEALTYYCFLARNSESEKVAGPQLSADYYALPGRQYPAGVGCSSC